MPKAAYYAAHREADLAASAAYNLANKSAISARKAAHYLAHREALRASRRVARAANPDKGSRRVSAWRSRHPQKYCFQQARHRAAKRNAPLHDFTDTQWLAMLAHYEHRCVYCKPTCQACARKTHELTQDHITPLSKGGSHTLANIVPACRSCNSSKQAGPVPSPVQPLLL